MAQCKQFSFTYFKHTIIQKGKSLSQVSLGIATWDQEIKSMYPEELDSVMLFIHESMLQWKYIHMLKNHAKIFGNVVYYYYYYYYPEVWKETAHSCHIS